MITLENLFNEEQKARLAGAIPLRRSCRSFAAPLSEADYGALCYAAARYALPGARLQILRVSESLFTGTLLNMGRVSGCTVVAAVIAQTTVERSRMRAGILGEALTLEAVAMGLGCCWISGTYRKKNLHVTLRDGEALLGIIALGVPSGPREVPTRRRKSLERLCRGKGALWPEPCRKAAAAVREAPSALNLQPWTMAMDHDRFILHAPDRAQLDLGIALCHAELALDVPHTWYFARGRKDPAAWARMA